MRVKLTDKDGKTYGGTQWGEGVTRRATGKGQKLCSEDVIHVYEHPLLAILANPIHADFDEQTMRMWQVKCEDLVTCDLLKAGYREVTTLNEIPSPDFSLEARVRVAILLVLRGYKDNSFVSWAKYWLSGKDRTSTWADEAASADWGASAAEAVWAACAAEAASAAWATGKTSAARVASVACAASITQQELIALCEQAIKDEANLKRPGR